ncbi:MAG: 6-phosphofructokinase [Phycisphaerae bacterium]|nr:6-phosphofructokinase [Phycisphaerae bacterium]
MAKKIKTIGVMTGGGDCPGLNAVIRAVAKTAITEHNLNVVGIHDGFLGLIENNLTPLSYDDVSGILTRGGTILGSSNKANPNKFAVEVNGVKKFKNVSRQCVKHAKDAGIEAIVCIGGDGTMSGAAGMVKHGLDFIGVPKTIDNDLWGTDVTFGFDTAVTTATEAVDKIHTTAASHSRVMIVEVMGRYAGWIALHAGVAGGADIILMPEMPYQLDKICKYIEQRKAYGRNYTIIVAAEGAKCKGGQMVVHKVDKFSPDPIRLGGVANKIAADIEAAAGIDCRATVLGHVQRGGMPSPHDRTLATVFGHFALEQLVAGKRNRVVVMKNNELTTVALSQVANKVRTVPKNYRLVKAAKAVGTSFGI